MATRKIMLAKYKKKRNETNDRLRAVRNPGVGIIIPKNEPTPGPSAITAVPSEGQMSHVSQPRKRVSHLIVAQPKVRPVQPPVIVIDSDDDDDDESNTDPSSVYDPINELQALFRKEKPSPMRRFLRSRTRRYGTSPKTSTKKEKQKKTLRDLNVERETETRRRRHDRKDLTPSPPAKTVHKDRTPSPSSQTVKRGEGVVISTDLMRFDRNKHASYTYWNDPNELVDRLRLLIASQAAGNNGHSNEIVSIIEELREANIIT